MNVRNSQIPRLLEKFLRTSLVFADGRNIFGDEPVTYCVTRPRTDRKKSGDTSETSFRPRGRNNSDLLFVNTHVRHLFVIKNAFWTTSSSSEKSRRVHFATAAGF